MSISECHISECHSKFQMSKSCAAHMIDVMREHKSLTSLHTPWRGGEQPGTCMCLSLMKGELSSLAVRAPSSAAERKERIEQNLS